MRKRSRSASSRTLGMHAARHDREQRSADSLPETAQPIPPTRCFVSQETCAFAIAPRWDVHPSPSAYLVPELRSQLSDVRHPEASYTHHDIVFTQRSRLTTTDGLIYACDSACDASGTCPDGIPRALSLPETVSTNESSWSHRRPHT
jgi:hypothetical protein